MDKFEAYEMYLDFEEHYDAEGRPLRHTTPRPAAKNKKKTPAAAEMTDFTDDLTSWVPSYAAALDPKHHERQWLIESLGAFYRDNILTDVTRIVKGGKEANVYCCTAHEATEVDLIAAKLYRPRMLRTLKNDAVYKAGRQLRGEDGKELKGRREKLALQQKTRFGQQLDTAWWINNEYSVQRKLYDVGAAVPRPIGHGGNAILMEFVGDESLSAPTLSDITLDRDEAEQLFDDVMRNITLMLDNHFIHGDLSAYNILYWEGNVYIIDFPQVVDGRKNPHAEALLQRDVRRVCEYFGRFGVRANPNQLARDLWISYMGSL